MLLLIYFYRLKSQRSVSVQTERIVDVAKILIEQKDSLPSSFFRKESIAAATVQTPTKIIVPSASYVHPSFSGVSPTTSTTFKVHYPIYRLPDKTDSAIFVTAEPLSKPIKPRSSEIFQSRPAAAATGKAKFIKEAKKSAIDFKSTFHPDGSCEKLLDDLEIVRNLMTSTFESYQESYKSNNESFGLNRSSSLVNKFAARQSTSFH